MASVERYLAFVRNHILHKASNIRLDGVDLGVKIQLEQYPLDRDQREDQSLSAPRNLVLSS